MNFHITYVPFMLAVPPSPHIQFARATNVYRLSYYYYYYCLYAASHRTHGTYHHRAFGVWLRLHENNNNKHNPAIVESNFPKPKSGTPSHALVFNDAFAISKQSIFYLRGGRPNKSRQRQLGILFPFDGCMRTSLLVQLLWHSVAGARTRHGKTRNKFVRCLVTEWPYGPRDNKIMHARRTTA